MSTRVPGLAWAALVGMALSACGRRDTEAASLADAGRAAAVASTATSARPEGTPGSSAPRGAEASKVPCRIVGLTGEVTGGDGIPLTPMGSVPPARWLTLGPGAKMTAKDPRSTRETAFEGPGKVMPCVASEEESWVAQGTFRSAPGAGEAPGAEEWVVTPFGVVRYAASDIQVNVGADALTASLSRGVAFLWTDETAMLVAGAGRDAGQGVDGDGWRRFDIPEVRVVARAKGRRPSDLAGAKTALELCIAASSEARVLAQKVQAPGAPLGELAPRHVIARRAARAACAVSRLRAEALSPSVEREELISRAREADRGWRAL